MQGLFIRLPSAFIPSGICSISIGTLSQGCLWSSYIDIVGFRSLLVDLGAVVTPGDQGIVVYKGFKVVATLSRADAEVLSPQDEKALRRAFNRLPT